MGRIIKEMMIGMKKILLVIGIVMITVSSAGLVAQFYSPYYEPATKVEYPSSSINISIPSITPNQSLLPSPYRAYDIFPEPGAKDIPLNIHISVSFPRPPQFLKLEVEPDVEISHVKKELIFYSGKYTFYLAKPLKPRTNYTVKIIAGQKYPPAPGVSPISTTTWEFTTGDISLKNILPILHLPGIEAIFVILGFLFVAYSLLRKR